MTTHSHRRNLGDGGGGKFPLQYFFYLRIDFFLATELKRGKKNWMRMGSESSDIVILDSDSDVPTTSSRKHLRPSAVVVTSDSETSAEEKESNEPESSDDKTIDV